MAEQINESHQRFLQVLMSHGIMESSLVRALHRHCCEVHKVNYMHDNLDDFVGVLNKHLQPLFMKIEKGVGEEDGLTYYALVNRVENDITKMASDYAENELELFRKTMELIIISENGFAPSISILNLADELQSKKMKKKEVEQLLQSFVQDKWLIGRNGEYTLHTRCIMELEHYILNTYQDVAKICNVCHKIAIQCQLCENCGIPLHLQCAGIYFRGIANPLCPNCKESWPHEIPDLSQVSSQGPSHSQAAPVRGRNQRSRNISTVARTSR
ncbi:hypothetical protein XENTR_v10024094 [Xenopus tropicalis]|nr:non-structural maintenance of chromosomes element 1 homolog isoform X1 [Xenopus tropicalis]XP_012825707.1 non-structural maintenance of chromosomes element 1 homolog isoform X1 [Xenopus tropicalis]KAE8579564.1 hypothetical protein XENTR_v10024094 [Xenopus tropicalis]KAE8579565.1 hypothetical protein XENTR_v10024094 [Xenopus tropicalis]|eukprot:XP_012825706.1 PREDICTED: non-structural maintenance of chromosomes element 1 homolog isoform X1 [Xenopus tropicalis]